MEPYPVGEDGVVRPLELLRKAKPTHVVSVAGCEARSLNPDLDYAAPLFLGYLVSAWCWC